MNASLRTSMEESCHYHRESPPPPPPRLKAEVRGEEMRRKFEEKYGNIDEMKSDIAKKIALQLFEERGRLVEENREVHERLAEVHGRFKELNCQVYPFLFATINEQINKIFLAIEGELPEFREIKKECSRGEKIELSLLIKKLKALKEVKEKEAEEVLSKSKESSLLFQLFDDYNPLRTKGEAGGRPDGSEERAASDEEGYKKVVAIPNLSNYISQLEAIEKVSNGELEFEIKISGDAIIVDGKTLDKSEAESLLKKCITSLGYGIYNGVYYSGKTLYYTLSLIIQLATFVTIGASFVVSPWLTVAYIAGRVALSAACFGSLL